MFKKLLIANRGEIAVRIHRACRELGIETVAVHSTADAESLHVKLANESVCIGGPSPKESYLNIPAILSAAELSGAEAIHPGYGFLAENADFAEKVAEAGLTWVGPSPAHIRQMGDKIEAKKTAVALGLPCVPGSEGALDAAAMPEAKKLAEAVGYPVLLKAAAGGGGRGMRVVEDEEAFEGAFQAASEEALGAFGDGRMYLEKYLGDPKHIEVQVLADTHGNVSILGERECSLQRRHQKIIEEAPAACLTPETREGILRTCHTAMSQLGYVGAGTLEFLYENGAFYFIEMNTRLQVEHPVTEMCTGVDIVAEQIRIAAGEKLKVQKDILALRGHAIECRVNVEDPQTFVPSPGLVTDYYAPGGPGVRVESMLYPDYTVLPYYDATVAKLVVWGNNRQESIARTQRALEEFIIGGERDGKPTGLKTNIAAHKEILTWPEVQDCSYTIKTLERKLLS